MDQKNITLECLIRAPDVVDLLEDYDRAANRNDYLYYLNGKQLMLDPSLQVREHSLTGFRHGYEGSGPAQLALAICLELYSRPVARAVYQRFKREFITRLPFEEEFKETLLVPINPLKLYKIDPESVDWEEPSELHVPTDEERKAEEKAQQEKKHWQQKLDEAYQKVLRLPSDQRFEFGSDARNQKDSYCYIRILDATHNDPKVTVISTDPGDDENAGMSITNAAEDLANLICKEFSIPPQQLRWIERYVDKPALFAFQAGRGRIEERWDEVEFDLENGLFSDPEWLPVSDAMIKHFRQRCDDRPDMNFPAL